MGRVRVPVVSLAFIAVLLVFTGAAQAQTPPSQVAVSIGGSSGPQPTAPIELSRHGYGADLAVAEDGTVHAAWLEPAADLRDTLHYCRLPRGTISCAVGSMTTTPTGTRAGGPQIKLEEDFGEGPRFAEGDVEVLLPSPGRVILQVERYARVTVRPDGTIDNSCSTVKEDCEMIGAPALVYSSTDGGVTFGPEHAAGNAWGAATILETTDGPLLARIAGAVVTFAAGPPERFSENRFITFDNLPDGDRFSIAPIEGSAETVAIASQGGRPTVAVLDRASHDPAFDDTLNIWLRRFGAGVEPTRETLNAFSPNPAGGFPIFANWQPWERLPVTAQSPQLAGGPSGLFLFYLTHNTRTPGWELRNVSTPGAPGAPVALGGSSPLASSSVPGAGDVAQDAAGRVYAAWTEERSGDAVIRAASSADGSAFSAPDDLARFAGPGNGKAREIKRFDRVRLDVADDGGGAVIFQEGDAYDFGKPATIRLVSFGSTTSQTVDDLRITGIEATQGVQSAAVPARSREAPSEPVSYPGPPASAILTESKRTVVRAYVTSRQALAGAVPTASLRVKQGGKTLQTVQPSAFPQICTGAPEVCTPNVPVAGEYEVPQAAVEGTNQVFTFELGPASEIQGLAPGGEVTLEAVVNPSGLLPSLPECATCRSNNVLRLGGLRFQRTTEVRIDPLEFFVGGVQGEQPRGAFGPSKDPNVVFGPSRAMLPMPLRFGGYVGHYDLRAIAELDVSAEYRQSKALDFVEERADDCGPCDLSSRFPIGLFPYDARNFTFTPPRTRASDGYWMRSGKSFNNEGVFGITGCERHCGELYSDHQPIAILSDSPDRDLITVTHEIGHGLGLRHAGTDSSCYTEESQVGEDWPVAADGRVEGHTEGGVWQADTIGTDLRPGSTAPFARIFSPASTPAYSQYPAYSTDSGAFRSPAIFDFMSYCSAFNSGFPASGTWISLRNWNYLASFRAPEKPSAAASGLRTDEGQPISLQVSALSELGGVSILDVTPSPDPVAPDNASGRPFGLSWVVRDSSGQPMFTGAVAASQSTDSEGTLNLDGSVPLRGAASVELVDAQGNVLASRAASSSPPSVRIISPRPRSAIGAGGRVKIDWEASDPEGDPVEVLIDYAPDGRLFRTVGRSAGDGSLTLPARLFASSQNGALRVRARDGFLESADIVRPLRSQGAPPLVRIISPAEGYSSVAGGTLTLEAEAYDDRGKRIPDGRLQWRLGNRVLLRGGTGGLAAALPAGRHKLTVQATDYQGRITRRAVSVEVTPAQPHFTQLSGPRSVSPTQRTLALRVASSFPARFSIAGRRVQVGPRPRTVQVPLRPGRRPFSLKGTLRSGDVVTGAQITVFKR